jgi:2',3'-cyclic-nucleotide 2'-phosphodiesterase (5'-nucleotidase family)
MKRPILVLFIVFAVFFGGLAPTWAGEAVQLRILYLNDFHGFAEPHRPVGSPDIVGGMAYLAGEVNRLRGERPTLLLAAGDMVQGHPWANLFDGKSTIEVMNAMNFSAMVLGNHEFDFGQKSLQNIIRLANFPVLAANVRGVPGLKPYIIKEIGGLKIAIIGLVTEETPTATHPNNVQGLTFTPTKETASGVLKELAGKYDLALCLSHLGFPEDRRLAEVVPDIQVIVGGHTHTRIENPVRIGDTLIVQAWEHAKVLGVLDLTIKDRKIISYEGKLISIGPERQQPDPPVTKIVDHYKNQNRLLLEEKIGTALTDLQAAGSRHRETTMGNLITDILRKETKADCALMNGGGLRADINKGPIRKKELFSVLPFPNYTVVVKVTGEELKALLEHGLSGRDGGGQFPQISGIRLEYSLKAPEGQRIKRLWVQDKPWNPQKWYSLATNDFIIAGGDGYDLLKNLFPMEAGYLKKDKRVLLVDSGRALRDLVIHFIKARKQISAKLEKRIINID